MDNTYEHEQYEQDRMTIDRLIAEYTKEQVATLEALNDPGNKLAQQPDVRRQLQRNAAFCEGAVEALHRVID